jgi:hypothetical protein
MCITPENHSELPALTVVALKLETLEMDGQLDFILEARDTIESTSGFLGALALGRLPPAPLHPVIARPKRAKIVAANEKRTLTKCLHDGEYKTSTLSKIGARITRPMNKA